MDSSIPVIAGSLASQSSTGDASGLDHATCGVAPHGPHLRKVLLRVSIARSSDARAPERWTAGCTETASHQYHSGRRGRSRNSFRWTNGLYGHICDALFLGGGLNSLADVWP